MIKEWFVAAIWACKNTTRCWTGVCFPVNVSQQSLWHKECQRWTPSHNRFPVQAPVMELCIASRSAREPLSLRLTGGQAGKQPSSQSNGDSTSISLADQLVSRSGKSVTAGGGLAHAARRNAQEDVRQSRSLLARSSCLSVNTAFWIWICYDSRWWQQRACLCTSHMLLFRVLLNRQHVVAVRIHGRVL